MNNKIEKCGIVMHFYRIERFLYIHHLKVLAQIIYRLIYLMFNCIIPPSCILGKNVKIAHGVGIVIHHRAIIGEGTKIYQNVTIGGGDELQIGSNCIIGASSTIIGKVHIGNNCKIGANTFVNFDVPDDCTVVGIRGKVVEH